MPDRSSAPVRTPGENRAALAFMAYRFVTRMYFHLPFLVLILLARGVSYAETGALVALFSLAGLLFGGGLRSWLDGASLRRVIVLAEVMKFTGLVLLILRADLGSMALAQVLSGLGYALSMGPDSQALRNQVSKERANEVEKFAHSLVFIALFIAAVIGGTLAQQHLEWTLLATVPASVIGILLIPFLAKGGFQAAPSGPTHLPTHPVTLAYGLIRGFLLAVFTGFLPIILFLEGGVSLVMFGGLVGLYSLAAMLTAWKSGRILAALGSRGTLLACLACLGVLSGLILIAGQSTANLFPVTILMGLALGFIRPAALQQVFADREDAAAEMGRGDQLAGIVSLVVLLVGFISLHLNGTATGVKLIGYSGLTLAGLGLLSVLARQHAAPDQQE